MATKAVWEYRGNPEQPALLVEFSNGRIITPEDVHFTLYRNKDDQTPEKKRQRILAADTDRLSYVGNNFSSETAKSNPLCKYFIGVLNKETGKMEVYDAEPIQMRPVLETDNNLQSEDVTDLSTRTYREKMDALIEAFGTNRQKRALSSRKLNQVGSEILNKAMVKAAEDIIVNKGRTELVKEATEINKEEFSSAFLPPCDSSADKPDDVYKFDDLISPLEYEALESVAAPFKNITSEELQQMTEKTEHTFFVLQELQQLKLAKDTDRQARVLWYLDNLIKFSHLKVVKRKDLITKGCPSIICGNVMRNFSVIVYKNGRIQNSVSGTMKSKIVAYVIALALHISDFQVDLTLLQRDLKLTENRMVEIAKAMGLKISKRNMFSDVSFEESHKIAILELPLIVYKPAGGMKKKRRM
ncbi:PREDICTED: DNA-directed RNA polymerase I subunit RPA49 [Nanorana parkeri]|uniref:DNA-directed RNA polymerase I subunit RPA49 n=1 Tax=Nanorana parkeri TaxID=125878 RepID=UPI0008550AF6|nr:PREDICTED: DNA-directed RNA polymerase I subunit RPA49 [Nanorana parkeri]